MPDSNVVLLGTGPEGTRLTWHGAVYGFTLDGHDIPLCDVRQLDNCGLIHWRFMEQRDWMRKLDETTVDELHTAALEISLEGAHTRAELEAYIANHVRKDNSYIHGHIVDTESANPAPNTTVAAAQTQGAAQGVAQQGAPAMSAQTQGSAQGTAQGTAGTAGTVSTARGSTQTQGYAQGTAGIAGTAGTAGTVNTARGSSQVRSTAQTQGSTDASAYSQTAEYAQDQPQDQEQTTTRKNGEKENRRGGGLRNRIEKWMEGDPSRLSSSSDMGGGMGMGGGAGGGMGGAGGMGGGMGMGGGGAGGGMGGGGMGMGGAGGGGTGGGGGAGGGDIVSAITSTVNLVGTGVNLARMRRSARGEQGIDGAPRFEASYDDSGSSKQYENMQNLANPQQPKRRKNRRGKRQNSQGNNTTIQN